MSYALVIKSGSFEENKLATVTLSKPVPCTGLSLDITEITATALGTQTITATATPATCTDVITWASSNTEVATVADGVVSIIGLGTATITATCGEYSATCAVTVDNVVGESDLMWATLYNSGSNDYAVAYIPNEYKQITFGNREQLDTAKRRMSATGTYDYYIAPQIMPGGTEKVNVVVTSGVKATCIIYFFDTETASVTGDKIAKMIEKDTLDVSNSQINSTIAVPSGADSICVGIVPTATHTSSDDPETVADGMGFAVTYKGA